MAGKRHRPDSLAKMREIKKAHGLLSRGPNSSNWKGGTYLMRGYRMVATSPEDRDRFAGMVSPSGYVMEHRLVMARKLGRPLTSKEVVHHRNGTKTDNRIRNLELSDNATHKREHQAIVRELRRLRRENEQLKSELLKFQKGG